MRAENSTDASNLIFEVRYHRSIRKELDEIGNDIDDADAINSIGDIFSKNE